MTLRQMRALTRTLFQAIGGGCVGYGLYVLFAHWAAPVGAAAGVAPQLPPVAPGGYSVVLGTFMVFYE